MSLLGKDLYRLKNEQKSRRFSPATAIRVGIQTLEALFELHSIGFISRDVKPGNFVVGVRENRKFLYIIDFGLARQYIDGVIFVLFYIFMYILYISERKSSTFPWRNWMERNC